MQLFVGALVGAAVALVFNLVRDAIHRRWAKADAAEGEERDRRRRGEERSAMAAEQLLELLDDLRGRFAGRWAYDDGPETQDIADVTAMIRRRAVLVADDAAARRMEVIAECADGNFVISKNHGERPSQIGYQLWREGRNALRAVLANESVPVSPLLESFMEAIAEEDEFFEWVAEQERQRARNSTTATTDTE